MWRVGHDELTGSQIDNRSFTGLEDDDSTQAVNHYILSGQMVHAAGPVMTTSDADWTFSIDMII